MSEFSRQASATTLAVEDVHHIRQATFLSGQLEHVGLSIALEGDERVEISRVVSQEGLATVLRQRHDARVDGHREDIYYGLVPCVEGQLGRLTILVDDLKRESEWVEAGEFEKIHPRHQALANKVIAAGTPDVLPASHDNMTEFLRLLHGAITAQHAARTA
jgi:hypothetical protein